MIGGGLSGSHIGKIAIGRALVLLKEKGVDVGLSAITNHPDETGLLGGLELGAVVDPGRARRIIAADIGGTNLRVGIVELKIKKGDITKAGIWKSSLWRHQEDDPTRDDAVAHMAAMIEELVEAAQEKKLRLAPFIAVGCRPDYPRRHHREGSTEPAGRLGRARLQPCRPSSLADCR